MTADECTFTGNSAAFIGGVGGGGYLGNVTGDITDCTFDGNSAGGVGGGLYNYRSSTRVSNSTVSNNSAFNGAGLYNDAANSPSTIVMTNCTVSGNSAGDSGGGIYNRRSGASGQGTVNASFCTVSNNSANTAGGGYYTQGSLLLANCVVDSGASGENIFNDGGSVNSLGYNCCDDNGSGFLTAPGDQINTDPLLGPLQDNGGPTRTHALLPGSPAIDAGNPSFTPPPCYDQRGETFFRRRAGRCDSGAYEVQLDDALPCPLDPYVEIVTPPVVQTSPAVPFQAPVEMLTQNGHAAIDTGGNSTIPTVDLGAPLQLQKQPGFVASDLVFAMDLLFSGDREAYPTVRVSDLVNYESRRSASECGRSGSWRRSFR